MVIQVLALLLVSLVGAAHVLAADWINLFDGKSLNGWSVHSGTAIYTVEDGAIVGTGVFGSPNTFLCTNREFSDFILEFEVLADPPLNSGVQFRSEIAKEETAARFDKDGKPVERARTADRVYGYQVEIAKALPGRPGRSGNIYDEARRGVFLDDFKDKPQAGTAYIPGVWNQFRVECRGDSIKTWVNGIVCADIKDSMTSRGIIGLQVHYSGLNEDKEKFKPHQVRWRKIRVKELP
jgi:hypothetical protein